MLMKPKGEEEGEQGSSEIKTNAKHDDDPGNFNSNFHFYTHHHHSHFYPPSFRPFLHALSIGPGPVKRLKPERDNRYIPNMKFGQ